jgi:hypothetical protein
VTTLMQNSAAMLRVTLVNRTDQPLTFTYDQPCAGPAVTGLGDFDLWDSCLQGACEIDPVPTTITLAPRERRITAQRVVTPSASTCNPQGLGVGDYRLGLTLANLQGATQCGPVAGLGVRAGNASY